MRTVLYGSNRIHGLAGLLIAAATVRLQAQQAAAPSPWKQGMPAAAASSTLAPVAPPPVASGLHRLNGIALRKGTLYIAELSQISKIDNIEDNLDSPPKPTVILADLPKDEPHGWKYLTVGPDEKLYFQVGVPCNICLPSDRHGRIYRVGLDGKDLEVYAYGIRLIVGMDWHPTLKQLRERPRLAVGGHTGGQAQSRHPARQGSFRLSLLPSGQLHRSGT